MRVYGELGCQWYVFSAYVRVYDDNALVHMKINEGMRNVTVTVEGI